MSSNPPTILVVDVEAAAEKDSDSKPLSPIIPIILIGFGVLLVFVADVSESLWEWFVTGAWNRGCSIFLLGASLVFLGLSWNIPKYRNRMKKIKGHNKMENSGGNEDSSERPKYAWFWLLCFLFPPLIILAFPFWFVSMLKGSEQDGG